MATHEGPGDRRQYSGDPYRPRARPGQGGERPRPPMSRQQPGGQPPRRPRPPGDRPTGERPRPPVDRRRYTGPDLSNEETVIFEAVGKTGTATKSKDKPPLPPLGKGGVAVRTVGELLITAGLVVLLFMVYELYVTDLFSAEKQAAASNTLDGDWAKERTTHAGPADGEAFARIHIPTFGADFNFTIQEGTSDAALEVGPGHYKGTAMPGERGNFAIAGHRVGKGAPFNDLDSLTSCDQVVIETQTDFFVYKVLPYDDEMANWESGKGADPKCKGVSTLRKPGEPGGGPYSKTFGRKVVLPSQGDAVNPVPFVRPDKLPDASNTVQLLTLTTCHPQFSARERLIITSVLTQQVPKTQVKDYTDLMKKLGGR
ncbi:class E sortase [Amycolatopsis samaneae]|uniref:Class E sortase n=1 Tax=Amycolatopsis samaneae TaxID=664691 RepID=A0ABW5GK04_9PSEU